jgi:hypothetical protein
MLYGILHAFPLLRSNAHILRLPFELWSLADMVMNIIITMNIHPTLCCGTSFSDIFVVPVRPYQVA